VTDNDATLTVNGQAYVLVPAKGASPCDPATVYTDADVVAAIRFFTGRAGQITVTGCFFNLGGLPPAIAYQPAQVALAVQPPAAQTEV